MPTKKLLGFLLLNSIDIKGYTVLTYCIIFFYIVLHITKAIICFVLYDDI